MVQAASSWRLRCELGTDVVRPDPSPAVQDRAPRQSRTARLQPGSLLASPCQHPFRVGDDVPVARRYGWFGRVNVDADVIAPSDDSPSRSLDGWNYGRDRSSVLRDDEFLSGGLYLVQ